MTDREKAIVMAYTGYCMLTGDKLSVFYEYVESIVGRPVYTHEMGTKVVDNLIKEKARPDFIALCADESRSENPNKWIPVSERLPEENGQYLVTATDVIDKPMIRIRSFAKNLKKVDPYDFVDAKGCGWYDYDSEFGYWQDTDVTAWMPLPEPYKEESEE